MSPVAFLSLPVEDQAQYLRQAALRMGVSPVVMEKEFWVNWVLSLLFSNATLKDVLVFKGGTSLSKVFGVIDRFSEDIDLSIAPSYLGVREEQVMGAPSRNQRDIWTQRLLAKCCEAVQDTICPMLNDMAVETLGARPGGEAWLSFEIQQQSHSPILFFEYPTGADVGYAYIPRRVMVELGSLTDQQPSGVHSIRPWVADQFPEAFRDWECSVRALEVERTFWEKATILHAEFYRESTARLPPRYSRHYADMAALARHPRSSPAASRVDLMNQVVSWKSRFYAAKWARYDLAVRGTFRLVPPPSRRPDLEHDYAAMRDMYLNEPSSFEEVMDDLAALERDINKG